MRQLTQTEWRQLQATRDNLERAATQLRATLAMHRMKGMVSKPMSMSRARYQPMGVMRREPEREIYRGVDITGIQDKLLKATAKAALDVVHSKGALSMVKDVTFEEAKARPAKSGRWYAYGACTHDGKVKLYREAMLELGAHELLFVALHELAHHALSHHSQPRTSADEQRLESEADALAYQWMS